MRTAIGLRLTDVTQGLLDACVIVACRQERFGLETGGRCTEAAVDFEIALAVIGEVPAMLESGRVANSARMSEKRASAAPLTPASDQRA